MTRFVQEMLQAAVSQVGVQEVPKGSNRGPQVSKYLASVGLNPGYAWCMAFVYWCAQQAEISLKEPNPLVRTAGVMKQWLSIPGKYKHPNPLPGDIFIMSFGHGTGHTGFVTDIHINGTFDTIEGNSNSDGSREGYEVCRHCRTTRSVHGFIRIYPEQIAVATVEL